MQKIVSLIFAFLSAKVLAVFMGVVLSLVLVIGVVTSDVGEIKLSWKLHDIPESEKVVSDGDES